MNKWQNTRRAVVEHMHFSIPLLSELLSQKNYLWNCLKFRTGKYYFL